jgi:5-methylcytosine-specific restriction enzyme A
MANKPSRPCAYPRCPNLATSHGYCDLHKKSLDNDRGTSTERGYDSEWRKVRQIKLDKTPLCERCSKLGLTVIATDVHHIDGDVNNTKYINLESLCHSCHSKETAFGRDKVY